jgi:hypothetical protein
MGEREEGGGGVAKRFAQIALLEQIRPHAAINVNPDGEFPIRDSYVALHERDLPLKSST